MEYLVIALLLALILVLAGLTFRTPDKNFKATGSRDSSGNGEKSSKFCPLCGSPLGKGENVKSKVFPASPGGKDSLMEVYGCPYCIPPGGKEKRICPSCGKTVPDDGFVMGRYFVKPGKRHLHILGCTLCRKIK